MAIRALFAGIGMFVVLSAGSVSAEFSIDTVSPDVPAVAEGDILIGFTNLTPPPLVVTPAASFGLLIGEELDALSNGIDTICPAGSPNCFTPARYVIHNAGKGNVHGASSLARILAQLAAGKGRFGCGRRFRLRVHGFILAQRPAPPLFDLD